MGKISPVSAKYIVHAHIQIEGVVDRPDVIGAVFGQTEGLLGSELELRELQRSGRIGRIEVKSEIKAGKSDGEIIIPSSLDKAETAIIAAALETIQRIGPCNAKVKVQNIEDVRISKRSYVLDRAKELLRELTDGVLPDSQEITEEVAQSVRMMEICEYGADKLPAGPAIAESEEVLVVEGRADVLNLLKNGFKNAVAMNGTSCPKTIIDLSKQKTITLFVDGDRGGDLIIKEVEGVAEIDYVCKAPDGKEVEEITKKEIHKALRGKVAVEQAKMEINSTSTANKHYDRQPVVKPRVDTRRPPMVRKPYERQPIVRKPLISPEQKTDFKKKLDDLVGTRGAYILDPEMNILGKVPTTELPSTLKSLGSGVYAVVFDGVITQEISEASEKVGVKYLVAMGSKIKPSDTRIMILTNGDL